MAARLAAFRMCDSGFTGSSRVSASEVLKDQLYAPILAAAENYSPLLNCVIGLLSFDDTRVVFANKDSHVQSCGPDIWMCTSGTVDPG
jgi:hypothetical protein